MASNCNYIFSLIKVSRNTQEMINDLLKSDDITADTILVMVNALYFQANWLNPFEPELTTNETFLIGGFESIRTPTMVRLDNWYTSYNDYLDADMLEIPYQDPKVSMYCFLPRQHHDDPMDDLIIMEQRLSAEQIGYSIADLEYVPNLRVYFPKFEITHDQSLKTILTNMGLSRIFQQNSADFSGIDGGDNGLHVANVLHQAFVSVSMKL